MQAAAAAARRDKSPGDLASPGLVLFFGAFSASARGSEEVEMGRQLIVDRAALLVIDMQQGGFEPVETSGIPLMDGYAARIERVERLVDRCRAIGVPVIFFQEV